MVVAVPVIVAAAMVIAAVPVIVAAAVVIATVPVAAEAIVVIVAPPVVTVPVVTVVTEHRCSRVPVIAGLGAQIAGAVAAMVVQGVVLGGGGRRGR